MCRLFPTITFNYGSLQCGPVKGLAIRSLSLSFTVCLSPSLTHTLSLLAHFWSLARLHVKTTQIAPCSLYTPHSSLYVSQPQPEYLTGTLLIHIFHCLGFLFFFFPPSSFWLFNPPPFSTWSLLLLLLLTPPSSPTCLFFTVFFSKSSPPLGPGPVCGSWRVQGQQGQ